MRDRTAVTLGLTTLPLYALLLVAGTLTPQPDQVTDPESWARFVSTDSYLIKHIATNVVGSVLVVLGTFALGAAIRQRAAIVGMALSVTGHVLFTVPGVISTFATPPIGQAYLRGNREVMTMEFADAMTVITLLAVLLVVGGSIVLGVAVARSGVFARWAGVLWAAAAVVFYLLGAALGMATTGASLVTQPVGAGLLAVAGGAMVWRAARS
ncbi:hypothetical protein [Paractinoplanes rishiriensis]|uniref:DUF4386 family protein n=1 Tax=Paractinoplanes rishiriensis TaxID=1050105 RepID=A0A919KCD7_9ACTN|nr:hypothetical protein [Actinoplanes rishiriensis]GIF00992.1 hypothetical protein Ari01nite_84560 [Actinoplanes rishiriensis]